ncbi:MAG: M14 family metallopeptidase [Patescibacteria group bacterium]|nr:M14 family metallopeptidase [Patescibacteria group bacterium]
MSDSNRRRAVVALVVIAICGSIALVAYLLRSPSPVISEVVKALDTSARHVVIGSSVQGRTIDAYTYGTGTTRLGFVGGIHGGYELNSVLLAYDLMDYLEEHPEIIPANLSVTVIPDANPDGVYKALGITGRFTLADVPTGTNLVPGRYNADTVDLNRNFDCNWQATSTFLGKVTSAGTAPFSEPEAKAIRDFVLDNSPEAMIFLHSKSGSVYASECNNGILPKTLEIMNVYAKATGYTAVKVFDAYVIHGDSEGWLASIGVPAITVELTTHEAIEWEKNLAGVTALFAYYKM